MPQFSNSPRTDVAAGRAPALGGLRVQTRRPSKSVPGGKKPVVTSSVNEEVEVLWDGDTQENPVVRPVKVPTTLERRGGVSGASWDRARTWQSDPDD